MVIEIPYVFIRVVLFVAITYLAIGYYWSALEFSWFFYAMFCTLLYFVHLGMLLVSLTPNVQVASILSSPCYAIINLFSGFMVPGPRELDYRFRDPSLLEEALTHSSYHDRASYDRLAFVGDSALNLAVTNCLHGSHPDLGPGELTALRAANVSTEKFARAAVGHGFYRYVRRNAEALDRAVEEFSDAVRSEDEGVGWMSYGGSSKKAPKVLADVVESIAEAVYIDSGLNLDKLWEVFKGILTPIITSKTLDEQPVTSLYKQCQKNGMLVQLSNFHKGSTNTIKVYADGKLIGSGSSKHKKIAKLNAARDALQHLSTSGSLNTGQDALQHLSTSESDEPKQIAKLNVAARLVLQPLPVSESDNNTDSKELKKGAKSRLNKVCKHHRQQPKDRVVREQRPPHNIQTYNCNWLVKRSQQVLTSPQIKVT